MEQELDLTLIKGMIKRRKGGALLAFGVLLSLFGAIAFLLPNMYQSSAIIMIQNPQLPPNLVQSMVTSYADQRIQGITQEISTRDRILNLANKFDLLPKERAKLTPDDIVAKIKKRIDVQTIDAEIKAQGRSETITIAFKLSYEDPDPVKAQKVVTRLTSYFMEKNLEYQKDYARNATQFLQDQLGEAKGRLDELEAKLAKYRQAHLEELPEFAQMNLAKIQKINDDITNLDVQIRQTEEQRAVITTRLAEVDPYLATGGTQVSSPQQRLEQLRLEEANLLSRYSSHNPLVQEKKREIKLLEKATGEQGDSGDVRAKLSRLQNELSRLKARYTDQHPAVKRKILEIERVKKELAAGWSKASRPASGQRRVATNPAYIELSSDAQKADVSIQSMKAQKAALEERLKAVYGQLHTMPIVSEEYNEMETDYANAKRNLAELQQKLAQAKLAQGMEDQQLGETFKVIEPAFLPNKPAKPNRVAILFFGLALAMFASIGTAAIMEYSDPRVYDGETVAKLAGLKIFSTIPTIVTDGEIRQARRRRTLIATGAILCAITGIVIFNFFVMDLHIFWVKLVRLISRKSTI